MSSGKESMSGCGVLGCCMSAYLEHSVWSFQRNESWEYLVFWDSLRVGITGPMCLIDRHLYNNFNWPFREFVLVHK